MTFSLQILSGDEFLLNRHLARELKAHVDSQSRDFDFEKLSAKSVKGADLLQRLRTPPRGCAHAANIERIRRRRSRRGH